MPMIDIRPFLYDDNILTVCKSIDGKGSQWIITDTDDDSVIKTEFGRIVLSWLNQINPLKPDGFNAVEQLITEINCNAPSEVQKKKRELWKCHFDSMVDFIMNKNIKTQDTLFDFYKRYRYLAHYYFSNIPFEERVDIPSGSKKPSEIVGYTFIENQPYQIIRVYGFTNFFVLDLWELLFNNSAKYKIKQCKKCNLFFRTSDKNRDYCIDCKKTNEDYAREYRDSPINRLRKSILTKLKTNKKFANTEGDKKTEKFKNDFMYYMGIIGGKTSSLEEPDDCDYTIKTENDFIKWLTKYEATVREYSKEVLENGETDETCERHGSNHKGIGETEETIPSDDNPRME